MMSLVPTTVSDGIGRLRRSVNEVFETFRSRWSPSTHEEGDRYWPTLMDFGGPPIDLEEDEDTLQVTAELPGLSKDDFRVEVLGDRLTIRGAKRKSRETKERNYYYMECREGAFSRSIQLPCGVDPDRIQAVYKNGLLKVTLHKTEPAKRIEVKVA